MRMRSLLACLHALVLFVGCASAPRPSDPVVESAVVTSDDLSIVPRILAERPGRTLLVLDIDDTLLTSPVFFGSDAWYEWQQHLAQDDPARVACRFDLIAMNYESGTQVPTQPDTARIVNAIRHDKIIITARSEDSRAATVRELRRAGIELPQPLHPTLADVSFDWRRPTDGRTVRVSYRDGVYMIAGQNKGLLLLELLAKAGLRYDRIVLVDDGAKNIDAMRAALADARIAYLGLHYTRIDKRVDAAKAEAGLAGWQAWQRFLAATFPQRLERLLAGDCAY
jgi:hypothetical protein